MKLYESSNSTINLNGEFIIKKLKAAQPTAQQLFQIVNEFEIVNYLNHPRIRKAVSKEANSITLEYVEGRHLSQFIGSAQPDWELWLKILVEVVELLDFIHQKGVVHQDITPYNILYNADKEEAYLIDFGIASRGRANNTKSNGWKEGGMRGSLNYIAPEQTGRIDRSVDHRADLYSLGVVCYQAFTGALPFNYENNLELVFAHIAEEPQQPKSLNPAMPDVLSNIVLKLLAKSPEDRYQTSSGLLADLKHCLSFYEDTYTFPYFEIGAKDLNTVVELPSKLYGREEESKHLESLFLDTIEQNHLNMVLVGGESGVGKSALASSLKPVVLKYKGGFLSGKHEKLQQSVPYFGFSKALTQLATELLSLEEERLFEWKSALKEAVDVNGQLLLDIVPEFEQVIGAQPEVQSLVGVEAQNRFLELFRNVLKTITALSGPTIIVLDDMQWSDIPMLNLIKQLMKDRSEIPVLFLCTYRTKEVHEGHPFIVMSKELEATMAGIERIRLEELNIEHIIAMLSDILGGTTQEHIRPLAKVIYGQTAGNAFFIRQILQELLSQNILYYDQAKEAWAWQEGAIKKVGVTENVLGLMEARIKRLSPETYGLLQVAACIGTQFNANMLASLSARQANEVEELLEVAIAENMIYPTNMAFSMPEEDQGTLYYFIHDRIRQALYDTLREEEREQYHLNIGRVLLLAYTRPLSSEQVFQAVSHFNQALTLLNEEEKIEVLMLNQEAGLKASDAIAYESACIYLQSGLSLLPENSWDWNQAVTRSLYMAYAENLGLLGELEECQQYFKVALEHAESISQKGIIYEKLSVIFQNMGNAQQALDTAKQGIAQFGLPFPDTDEGYQEETKRLMSEIANISTIDALNTLPLATEEQQVVGNLYSRCVISTYFAAPQYLGFFVSKSIEHLLQAGASREASVALGWFAMILGVTNQHRLSWQYASAALEMANKFADNRSRGRTVMLANAMSLAWKVPYQYSEEAQSEAYSLSHSAGDLQYASYALITAFISSLARGNDYYNILQHCKTWHDYCEKYVPLELGQAKIRLQMLHRLMDIEHEEEIDEEGIIAAYEEANNATDVSESLIEMARIAYVFEEYEQAYEYCQRAKPLVEAGAMGNLLLNMLFYVDYACISASMALVKPEQKDQFLEEAKVGLDKLADWAAVSPANFKPFYQYAKAIWYRSKGEWAESLKLAGEGLKSGKQQHLAFLSGQLNELMAKLYADMDLPNALDHWNRAVNFFMQCGAQKKARLIESFLIEDHNLAVGATTTLATTSTSAGQSLDLEGILRASQAISEETTLSGLLEKMVKVIREVSGAQRCLMMLPTDGKWHLEAILTPQGIETLCKQPLITHRNNKEQGAFSLEVVNYVRRAKKTVILTDAVRQRSRFRDTPYVQAANIRSLCCFPLMRQNEVIGMLYLENNLAPYVFTEGRIEVLNMLSSQLTTSINNARLYASLEAKVDQRTQEVVMQKDIIEKKNKNITASLNYAQRIQVALLPYKERIDQYIPEHFTLYMPRDIVSGDFYWFQERNEKLYVLVGDCTGHGIPGAFMSMLGSSTLDYIFASMSDDTDAGAMLDQLDLNIRRALQQDDNQGQDGMDVSLCIIDRKQGTIQLAAAMSSVLYWQHNELHRFKGTSLPIGGQQKKKKKAAVENQHFQTLVLPLLEDTNIYLFTDGIKDQFGGLDDRKFSLNRLQKLLKAHASLPMNEQGQKLSTALNNWMNPKKGMAFRQIDDILFMGLKVS